MRRIFAWLWKLVANIAQAWQLLAWLIPTGAVSAMTGIAARAVDLPLYLIVLYTACAFSVMSVGIAALFHALLRAVEWRHKTTVQGKLDYLAPFMGVDVDWDRGKARFIKGINIGFQMRNIALFPVDYIIKEYHATLEGRAANTDQLLTGKVSTAIAGSIVGNHPNAIDISDLRKTEVSGRIEFKVVYGRHGRLLHEIVKNLEFDLVLHPETSVKPNPSFGISVRDRV